MGLNFDTYDEMFRNAQLFHIPFPKLEKVIRAKYSQYLKTFNAYRGSVFYLIQSLEFLCTKFKNDRKYWKAHAQTRAEFLRKKLLGIATLEEEDKQVKRTQILSRSIQQDVDSFFIFARILLDRIPYLLEPFFEGVVTCKGTTPTVRGYKAHLSWFVKNEKHVLDKAFLEEMKSFLDWFEANLFVFRDDIIVPPRQFQIK